MNSGLLPLATSGLASAPAPLARVRRAADVARQRSRPRAPASRGTDARPLVWCTLAVALLTEAVVLMVPGALLRAPWQTGSAFKMASGYPMFGLLALAMGFGWLRRQPRLAARHRALSALHQWTGLLLLLLLAAHAAGRPAGFLQLTFQAMALGQGAGAVRVLFGARMGRRASTVLLVLHITLACLVCAAALLHLYLVYVYTA
jgi:hypothetical protein